MSALTRWIDDPTAQLLLESRAPARLAWIAADGAPRVVPMWFSWEHERAAFCVTAFAGAHKLGALLRGSSVALTIDSDDFPYRSLNVRGTIVSVEAVAGITDEYVRASQRYLGPQNSRRWIEQLGTNRHQVRILIEPQHVTVADLARDSSFLTLRD
jgi:nitroimidazol reductase NimA-like FMN-containing flavoprotein (pyridoxamine 5'-phosphate oxidase superfamily)